MINEFLYNLYQQALIATSGNESEARELALIKLTDFLIAQEDVETEQIAQYHTKLLEIIDNNT